jgi:pyruvate formate lyase activating enzyme
MNIQGFQKLTLLDYPGLMACTVFTGGCNFRCPFCHNASLVTEPDENEPFTEQEILDYLEKRKNTLEAVCITGGEPLLEKELPLFLEKIKATGKLIKLDTNGYLSKRLKDILNAGLVDYVAMDIKNSPEKYPLTAGLEGMSMDPIYESIDAIMNAGIDYEFRTTVVKELHSEEDFEKISEMIKGCKKYYIQSFTDSGNILGSGLSAPSRDELFNFLAAVRKNGIQAELRGID